MAKPQTGLPGCVEISLILVSSLEVDGYLQAYYRGAGLVLLYLCMTALSYACHILLQSRRSFPCIPKLNPSLQERFPYSEMRRLNQEMIQWFSRVHTMIWSLFHVPDGRREVLWLNLVAGVLYPFCVLEVMLQLRASMCLSFCLELSAWVLNLQGLCLEELMAEVKYPGVPGGVRA